MAQKERTMKTKTSLIIVLGIVYILQPLSAQTWESTKRLTWNSGSSLGPDIKIDTNDTIHFVWSDDTPGNSEIYHKKSKDGGTTWFPFKRITWNSGNSAGRIAIDSNNHIHLVWSDNSKDSDIYEIYYKKSTDGGATWIGTKRLTWTAYDSGSPVIAVDSANNIHIVWVEKYTRPALPPLYASYWELYYKRSTNGGNSWINTKRLTWFYQNCQSPDITIDTDDTIHLVWAHRPVTNDTTIYDIYYKRSTSSGVTWTSTKRLTWTSEVSRSPSVASFSNSTIHLVWEIAMPGNDEIHYKRSVDGGATWSGGKQLTWNTSFSKNSCIAADSSNRVYIVWRDNITGDSEIYFKKSTDGGISWISTKRLTWNSGTSLGPDIGLDSLNNVHILWSDDTPSQFNYEIYYKKGTQ